MVRIIVYFALNMVLLVVAGCTSGSAVDITLKRSDPPASHISLGSEYYNNLTWYPGERLLAYRSNNDAGTEEYLDVATGERRELVLPADTRCRFSSFSTRAIMPDGRLGLIHRCIDRWPENEQARRNAYYLSAYNLEQDQLETLIAEPLSNRLIPGPLSWNPDMTRGVQQVSGDRATLWWLTPTGSEPMTLTINSGTQSWTLADNLWIMDSTEDEVYFGEHNVGTALSPVWSPDGDTLAFMASTAAIGREGLSRMWSEFELYIMDPKRLEPESMLGNIFEPSIMMWSPDSEWLAFTAGYDSVTAGHLLIFSPARKMLFAIPSSMADIVAWSPTGDEIAVLSRVEGEELTSEVIVYQVGNLLR